LPVVCPECGGRGVVSEAQGLFAFSQPCPRCHGNGSIVEKPCRRCRGTGRERTTKRYSVKIPAGAKSGTRIRLKGKGEAGHRGGPPGDLYVVVDVEPSQLFRRRGSDLVLDVPVTYAEAALGANVQIPTPDGPVSLKIPAGTEPGKLLRVKGRGAPHLKGNGKGDLLARISVTVPKKLSKAERQALEEYGKVSRERPRERVFAT
jgi:molecular chaperone DnaJ